MIKDAIEGRCDRATDREPLPLAQSGQTMETRELAGPGPPARSLAPWLQVLVVAALAAMCVLGLLLTRARSANQAAVQAAPPVVQPNRNAGFLPTASQLATLTIQDVVELRFQLEHGTEGKIAVDDDRTTPIFSSYSGRVTRLLAKTGDMVRRGQVLFTIEAGDMVQAQNDLIAANGELNKARSKLQLAQTIERRQRELNEAKAVALKELQTAQNDLVSAQNDLRAAEGGVEAVRNRLRILGRTDDEVATFLGGGRMSAETPIVAPIDGTVTQRKVGPGQYVGAGSGDPAYIIGDLSNVWLIASVRESEAPRVAVGQAVRFRVLAFGDRAFEARVSYVASAIDPASRRVQVRAEVDNREGLLKPEMFASVRIATGKSEISPAVPREAVIYEADKARVWAVAPDGSIAIRAVETGLVSGNMLQITKGLGAGDRVVVRGSLFIDRLASGGAP